MKQLSHLLSASSAKQIFFWSCILTHVLCVYNWVVDSRFLTWALNFQASNCYLGEYYCDIGQWILVNGGVSFLFSLYLFSILVAGIYGLFSMSRWANGFLIFSFLLKCFFISQSYFLIGNYHHIVFFLHLAYFFAKNKVLGVWWILFCSYFFAGLLKLNFNWITGQDFIVDPWFAGPFLIPLCVAAVIMECFLIFFIWSKDKKKRIVLYVTLISFHFFSWPIVGYFYPLSMLGVLIPAIYLRENSSVSIALLKKERGLIFISLIYAFVQFPYWIKGEEARHQGLARAYGALHMLDGNRQCDVSIRQFGREKLPRGAESEEILKQMLNGQNSNTLSAREMATVHYGLSTRLNCDPFVYILQAKQVCREFPKSYVALNFSSWRENDLDDEAKKSHLSRLYRCDDAHRKPSSIAPFWSL